MSVSEIPVAIEAERALIAACLRNRDAFYGVSVPAEAFHVDKHRIVWTEISRIYQAKRAMECPLLLAGMRDRLGVLEDADKQYVSKLFNLKTTEAPRYAIIVLDKWWLRRAINTFGELLVKVQQPGAEKAELRAEVEERFALMLKETSESKGGKLSERLPAYLDELSGRAERLRKEGVSFGLSMLDSTLGFQQSGDLLTIGSHSGEGKSMLALQGAVYNAVVRGLPVGFISLEMSESQNFDRLFSHVGQISMNGFKTGEFSEEGWNQIHWVQKKLATAPFHFYREKNDLDRIKSLGRRLSALEGIKLLVIDYLQMIRKPGHHNSRQEELEFIANDLKQFADEIGATIWCPVQLNKAGEVRGAMDILQASDISFRLVMEKAAKVNGKLEIDKSRQGDSTKNILMKRNGWFMTIEEREE